MYDLNEPCGVGYCNVTTFASLSDTAREGTARWQMAQPPEVGTPPYWWPVLVVVVGMAALGSGTVAAVVFGVLLVVGGAGWAVRMWRDVEAARAARATWGRRRYCLACDKRIAPETASRKAA